MAATDGIGCIRYGAVWQLWIGLERYGWDGSGWVRQGEKGAYMNQVMINAAELQAMEYELKELRDQKALLEKQLAEAKDRIKILKEEVQWALNGYIKK